MPEKVGFDGAVDVHHHMIPPFYVEALGSDAIAAVMPNGRSPEWSIAADLAMLDEYRISKAILSLSPGIWGLNQEKTTLLARRANEYGATIMHERPDRYGHFAILPLPDIADSLEEAAYALDSLKATGLVVFTNYRGVYLGDKQFEPLWQELHRRKAVVFVHPTLLPYSVTNIPPSILEFPFDTTRTVTSLIYAGVTRRYTDIKFIFSHGGGAVPFLAGRIDAASRMNPALAQILPDGVIPELKKLYWDTALTFSEMALKSLLVLTDASKILFGSDFPFAPRFVTPIGMKSLKEMLSPTDHYSVMRRAAIRLMPTLA